MNPESTERRQHPRSAASGDVWIAEDAPGTPELQGSLIDISAEGFRAAFKQPSPATGSCVRFRIPSQNRQGFARVMWRRILGGMHESGFHLSLIEQTPAG